MNNRTYDPIYLCKRNAGPSPMIGDIVLNSDEAYNIWIKFLKEYRYFGIFMKLLNKTTNGNCQSYKSFFKQWTQYTMDCLEKWNKNAVDCYKRIYYWTEDIVLLMPFTSHGISDDEYEEYKEMLFEILKIWEMHCNEKHIFDSLIKLDENFKPYETINNTRYTWKDILERYNYPLLSSM